MHVTRDFLTCYSCSYYSSMVQRYFYLVKRFSHSVMCSFHYVLFIYTLFMCSFNALFFCVLFIRSLYSFFLCPLLMSSLCSFFLCPHCICAFYALFLHSFYALCVFALLMWSFYVLFLRALCINSFYVLLELFASRSGCCIAIISSVRQVITNEQRLTE